MVEPILVPPRLPRQRPEELESPRCGYYWGATTDHECAPAAVESYDSLQSFSSH
jgi:hypothetical protein